MGPRLIRGRGCPPPPPSLGRRVLWWTLVGLGLVVTWMLFWGGLVFVLSKCSSIPPPDLR